MSQPLTTAANPWTQKLARAASALGDAFAWPLATSHYLELVNPLWSTHALPARVEALRDETADARTLTLRPGRSWRTHRAGQYIRVGLAIDGRRFTRTYSISSPPERDDGCITITVKTIEGGRVSQRLARQVRVGDYLSIGLPQGDFVLPDAAPVAPLFITAGSGITPIMSMLRSMIARERLPKVVHVHYAPRRREVIFGHELAQLAGSHARYALHLQLTREASDSARSHFSAAQLEALCPDWRAREAYACGPHSLLEALEQHYESEGLSDRLHTERFGAQLVSRPAAVATPGEVTFTKSQVRAASDGVANLLRLAEDAGLNPAHGCRMGVCHSCDATLKGGCVRDLRTDTIISEPGQTVQICVCTAAGDAQLEL